MYNFLVFAPSLSEIAAFCLALVALLMMFFTKKLAFLLCKQNTDNVQKVYFGIKLIAFAIAIAAVAILVFLK